MLAMNEAPTDLGNYFFQLTSWSTFSSQETGELEYEESIVEY